MCIIYSPVIFTNRDLPYNINDYKNKDLLHAESSDYKPAYKQDSKKQENSLQNLPPDLAEIVAVWPELPEHIKAAIKVLKLITKKAIKSSSLCGMTGISKPIDKYPSQKGAR
jgi:hypothetical protein